RRMCWRVSTKRSVRLRPSWLSLSTICNRRSMWPKWPEMLRWWGHSMPITVQIPTALRRHTAGVGSIQCAATNLDQLFSVLDEKFPDLRPHLRDDKGQVRRFLNIYVNEEDIRFLGGPSYAFQEGDEVLLVPSIAGGCN